MAVQKIMIKTLYRKKYLFNLLKQHVLLLSNPPQLIYTFAVVLATFKIQVSGRLLQAPLIAPPQILSLPSSLFVSNFPKFYLKSRDNGMG